MPDDIRDQVLAFLRDPVLPVALTVIVAVVVIRYTRAVVHRVFETALAVELRQSSYDDTAAMEAGKRVATLDALVTWIIRGFVLVIAGFMILGQLGVDIGPALAGLGIAGIAIGFGAQSLVRDYFNGALILLENQFSRGDVVTIANTTGTVEDFSLRRTTLRDLDGVLHTVPNSEIHVASNRTRVWAGINLDVTVAHGTDVDSATEVVNDVGRALKADGRWGDEILETPRVLRVENIGEFGITLKVVGKVRAGVLPATSGELRRRLLAAFATHGIELPRPQRVVLAKDPMPDPFAPGGPATPPTGPGPSQDELSAGSE
jgi:moderate conductance mechanosensitive channel